MALAAVLGLALSDLPPRPVDFDTDQMMINMMVLKELKPDALQRDGLFGTDAIGKYTRTYVWLQSRLSTDGNYATGLRRISIGVAVLFLSSHYWLFRYLGAEPTFAGMGALSAMTWRYMLAGEYWGYGGIPSVHPRAIANALAPVLLVLFAWRDRPWSILTFFLASGIIVLLHPVSGLHLALAGAVTYLILERFRPHAWGYVSLGAALFGLAAMPFLATFFLGRDEVAEQALFGVIRSIQEQRWGFLFFPQSPSVLRTVAFHIALPAAVLIWAWRASSLPRSARRIVLFGLVGFGGAIAGTAAIQVLARLTDTPYVTYEHLRMSKLLYPALVVGFPLFYQRLWSTERRVAKVAVGLVFVLSLIPPHSVVHASASLRQQVRAVLGAGVARPLAEPASDLLPDDLAAWVRTETPVDALFLTDLLTFRVATERSITGAFKDAGIHALAGTRRLYEWYLYYDKARACRAQAGAGCWFELGNELKVDYVVVDPRLSAARAPSGFIRVWNRAGWSVWKRRD